MKYFSLLSVFFAVVTSFFLVGFFYSHQVHNLPPAPINCPPEEFSETRAWKHLVHLSEIIGQRLKGSFINDVLVPEYFLRILSDFPVSASNIQMEVNLQTSKQDYYSWPRRSMTLTYSNVTNVLVRLSDVQSDHSSAILVSGHFDSGIYSPGAADDGYTQALMLEVIRAFVQSENTLHHDIIFNFNGAEEVGLLGAHAFVSQHPWAKQVKVFLNLESAGGGGGRLALLRTSKGDAWLVKKYVDAEKYPLLHSLVQDIMTVLPSDTDLSVYGPVGNWSGLDLAFVTNPYVYHTHRDSTRNMLEGSLQAAGETLLSLIRELAVTDSLSAPTEREAGRAMFYDILGLWGVSMPMYHCETMAVIKLLYFVARWLVVRIYENYGRRGSFFRKVARTVRVAVGSVFFLALHLGLSLLSALAVAALLALPFGFNQPLFPHTHFHLAHILLAAACALPWFHPWFFHVLVRCVNGAAVAPHLPARRSSLTAGKKDGSQTHTPSLSPFLEEEESSGNSDGIQRRRRRGPIRNQFVIMPDGSLAPSPSSAPAAKETEEGEKVVFPIPPQPAASTTRTEGEGTDSASHGPATATAADDDSPSLPPHLSSSPESNKDGSFLATRRQRGDHQKHSSHHRPRVSSESRKHSSPALSPAGEVNSEEEGDSASSQGLITVDPAVTLALMGRRRRSSHGYDNSESWLAKENGGEGVGKRAPTPPSLQEQEEGERNSAFAPRTAALPLARTSRRNSKTGSKHTHLVLAKLFARALASTLYDGLYLLLLVLDLWLVRLGVSAHYLIAAPVTLSLFLGDIFALFAFLAPKLKVFSPLIVRVAVAVPWFFLLTQTSTLLFATFLPMTDKTLSPPAFVAALFAWLHIAPIALCLSPLLLFTSTREMKKVLKGVGAIVLVGVLAFGLLLPHSTAHSPQRVELNHVFSHSIPLSPSSSSAPPTAPSALSPSLPSDLPTMGSIGLGSVGEPGAVSPAPEEYLSLRYWAAHRDSSVLDALAASFGDREDGFTHGSVSRFNQRVANVDPVEFRHPHPYIHPTHNLTLTASSSSPHQLDASYTVSGSALALALAVEIPDNMTLSRVRVNGVDLPQPLVRSGGVFGSPYALIQHVLAIPYDINSYFSSLPDVSSVFSLTKETAKTQAPEPWGETFDQEGVRTLYRLAEGLATAADFAVAEALQRVDYSFFFTCDSECPDDPFTHLHAEAQYSDCTRALRLLEHSLPPHTTTMAMARCFRRLHSTHAL